MESMEEDSEDEFSSDSNESNAPEENLANISTKFRSKVYDHCTLVKNGRRFKCNYCPETLNRIHGNTSTVWRHLNNVHNIERPRRNQDEEENEVPNEVQLMDHNSQKCKDITAIILNFIIKDLEPFNVVTHREFTE